MQDNAMSSYWIGKARHTRSLNEKKTNYEYWKRKNSKQTRKQKRSNKLKDELENKCKKHMKCLFSGDVADA